MDQSAKKIKAKIDQEKVCYFERFFLDTMGRNKYQIIFVSLNDYSS